MTILDNVPILCSLAATCPRRCRGAPSGAIPGRSSGARPVADRAGVPDRAVPASVALSRHRPGRRDRYGACLGSRAENGGGNALRADPPSGPTPRDLRTRPRRGGQTAGRPQTSSRVPAVRVTASETGCRGVAGSGASSRHRDDKTAAIGGDARPLPRGAAGTGSRASLHTWVPAASRVPRVGCLEAASWAMPPAPMAGGDDDACIEGAAISPSEALSPDWPKPAAIGISSSFRRVPCEAIPSVGRGCALRAPRASDNRPR
jgi:hypothetical protein